MKILTDLHCHTIASDHAYSTLREITARSAELGLEAVAVTDHGIGMEDAPHIWHFQGLNRLPDYVDGVRLLSGCEANIMNIHGEVDMPNELLERLDIVIASIHTPCYADNELEDHTEAYLAVVENPYIDIIGHSGTRRYPYDYDTVIKRAAELGKLIEINAASFEVRKSSIDNCRIIAEKCKKYGAGISVNSDAHFYTEVGEYSKPLKMLAEIDFPRELVMNRSYASLKEFMRGRGKEV